MDKWINKKKLFAVYVVVNTDDFNTEYTPGVEVAEVCEGLHTHFQQEHLKGDRVKGMG